MTPGTKALFNALLTMIEMPVMLLLEKRTRKTSANSSLPGSLTPFDRTAPPKTGAKGKGPTHGKGECANVRLEVDQRASAVGECGRCGEDLSGVAVEDRQRRAVVDIELVAKETRIDALNQALPELRARQPRRVPRQHARAASVRRRRHRLRNRPSDRPDGAASAHRRDAEDAHRAQHRANRPC